MRSPLNAGVHKNSTVPAARCDKVWKMTLRREPQETCGDLVLPANFRDYFRVTDQSEIRHSKFHGKFLFYQNERWPVEQKLYLSLLFGVARTAEIRCRGLKSCSDNINTSDWLIGWLS